LDTSRYNQLPDRSWLELLRIVDQKIKPAVLIIPDILGSFDMIGPVVLVCPAVEDNVACEHLRPPSRPDLGSTAAGALVDGGVVSAAFLRMLIGQ
jgi:hypothetical protein